jgi:hypothetical protein
MISEWRYENIYKMFDIVRALRISQKKRNRKGRTYDDVLGMEP